MRNVDCFVFSCSIIVLIFGTLALYQAGKDIVRAIRYINEFEKKTSNLTQSDLQTNAIR